MKDRIALIATFAFLTTATPPLAAQPIPDQYIGFLDYGTSPWWLSMSKAEADKFRLQQIARRNNVPGSFPNVEEYLRAYWDKNHSEYPAELGRVPTRVTNGCLEIRKERDLMGNAGRIAQATKTGAVEARDSADWILEAEVVDSAQGFALDGIGTLLHLRVRETLAMKPYVRAALLSWYGEVPESVFVFQPVARVPGVGCMKEMGNSSRVPVIGAKVWALLSIGGDPARAREVALRDARDDGESVVKQTVNPSHAMFLDHSGTTLFLESERGRPFSLRSWPESDQNGDSGRWSGRAPLRRWLAGAGGG